MEWTEESTGRGFTQFVETRITEGENLKKDILAKLTFLEQEVSAVEETFSTDCGRIPTETGRESG